MKSCSNTFVLVCVLSLSFLLLLQLHGKAFRAVSTEPFVIIWPERSPPSFVVFVIIIRWIQEATQRYRPFDSQPGIGSQIHAVKHFSFRFFPCVSCENIWNVNKNATRVENFINDRKKLFYLKWILCRTIFKWRIIRKRLSPVIIAFRLHFMEISFRINRTIGPMFCLIKKLTIAKQSKMCATLPKKSRNENKYCYREY